MEDLRKRLKEFEHFIKGIKTIENVDVNMLVEKIECIDGKERSIKKVEILAKEYEWNSGREKLTQKVKEVKVSLIQTTDKEQKKEEFNLKSVLKFLRTKRN